MNPKHMIADAHYTVLNGAWLFDQVSRSAMKVLCKNEPSTELVPNRGTGYLRDTAAAPSAGPEGQSGGLYRVFSIDDLADEGRFSMVADPWLPAFYDASFLRPTSFTEELDKKLEMTRIYGSIPATEWLRAIMRLPEEVARRILEDHRMADCPVDYWSLRVMGSGAVSATLAGWIDLWYGNECPWICPDCGGRVFAYEGRSMLTRGSLDGLCSACGHEVRSRGHMNGQIMRFIEVLRRHPPLQPDWRPYRIDTILSLLGAAYIPGRTGNRKGVEDDDTSA